MKLTIDTAETLAEKFRVGLGINSTEPVNMKSIIRQLNIQTVYRNLSENLHGISIKSASGEIKFILVNSANTRGRQHFTIAHELYHLFYDEDPKPHFTSADPAEKSANLFAAALLMPRKALIEQIPDEELMSKQISFETALKVGQLYGVSNSTLAIRLKDLKLISNECKEKLFNMPVRREASLRGMDLSLYSAGNKDLIISDFGIKARNLYETGIISEGHYMELLNLIGYGENTDCP